MIVVAKSFDSHKSSRFRQLKFLICSSNKLASKHDSVPNPLKLSQNSPNNAKVPQNNLNNTHYTSMIRKIQKEAVKTSFFKDQNQKKFNKLTLKSSVLKTNLKTIPSQKADLLLNPRVQNSNKKLKKLNSIGSTSRTNIKSTSQLNEDFNKKFSK